MFEIIIGSTLAFFGFIGGRLIKPKQKHEHIWKPVSSQHLNLYNGDSAQRPMKRTTKILKVCYCGENTVQTIEGNWDFKQLTSHEL